MAPNNTSRPLVPARRWNKLGLMARLDARIVNYADSRAGTSGRGTAEQAATAMRSMMAGLKLTVNETKTQVCQVPAEKFDFLGYTFGEHRSARTGRKMLCGAPSASRIARVCDKISVMTGRKHRGLSEDEMVMELNQVLNGWANYFCLGPVSKACRKINSHVRYRFRRWWEGKHKTPMGAGCWGRWLEQTLGLIQLKWDPSRLPHAKA